MLLSSTRPLGALFLSAALAVCSTGARSQAQSQSQAQAQAQAQDSAATPAGNGMFSRAWNRATDADGWQQPGVWRINVAPFSHHFRYSEEHRYVWAIGAEKQTPDDWLAGGSFFRNSFGQPSAYAYIGRRFTGLFGQPPLFAQVSAGALYGYVGKYQRKVPLNVGGFSPGALVSLGWQLDNTASATVHLLGDAGFMLQLSYDFR